MITPSTLCVRIHTSPNSPAYDWYDKTQQDLEENYILYGGMILHRSVVQNHLGTDCWMENDLLTEISPAELYNYEVVTDEDPVGFEFCKKAYKRKYAV